MGRGGYTGGSTIIGPWSSGWFSSPKKKAAEQAEENRKAAEAKKARKAAKAARAEASRKAAAASKPKKRNVDPTAMDLKAPTAKKAKQAALKKVSPPKLSPEQIAARLGRHMEGVEVRRITKNTLRLKKPAEPIEPGSAAPPRGRDRLR